MKVGMEIILDVWEVEYIQKIQVITLISIVLKKSPVLFLQPNNPKTQLQNNQKSRNNIF
jgi:hypothetical protein